MKRSMLCVLLVMTLASGALATLEPMEVLKRAFSIHKGLKDYIATVSVTTDIPGVDIPHRTAKVYVKLPDKVYVESTGIVFIPKRALLFGGLDKDIEKEAKVILGGIKVSGGVTTYFLKIMPKNPADAPKGHQPRVLVWINGTRWTIERVQVTDGPTLLLSVDFIYAKIQGFWMATKVACTVPKGTMGSDRAGHLTVTFANYRLNTGLTDEFFKEKERKSRGAGGHRRHRPPH